MLDKRYQSNIVENGCPICGAVCLGTVYGENNCNFTSWKCTNEECSKSEKWTGVPFYFV